MWKMQTVMEMNTLVLSATKQIALREFKWDHSNAQDYILFNTTEMFLTHRPEDPNGSNPNAFKWYAVFLPEPLTGLFNRYAEETIHRH